MSTTTIFPSEVIHDFHPPLPECPSWFRQELYENAKNIAIIIILGLINAIVILGNLLVVMAVFASAKLRTVTNFLIVSLAISDLLVGLAVLPYSISLEVLEFWIFGELWCQMWLAVDVWLCTASILNLCAISIDRYLAITRPVHYRAIMSTKRVRLLIAAVWVLSFIICFPPLVGWNDRVKDDDGFLPLLDGNVTQFRNFNYTTLRAISNNFTDDSNATSVEEVRYILRNATARRCPKPQCALITNPGYVIYSALGSFYIPMLVMLFFYYRIYVVALKTSRALDRGFKSTKSTKRGKGSAGSSQDGGSAGPSDVTLRIHRGRPTNESMPSSSHNRSGDILVPRRIPTVVYHHSRDCSSASNSPRCFREDSTKQYYTAAAKPSSSSSELTIAEDGNPPRNGRASLFSKSSSSSKRQARWHAKRFRTEAKATKTVGIIVGGFILCWLPFFTVYLIVGFCEPCIPELLFKVFFYLGYCNSALNPIIYGIISKDFRFAFRKILCRCTLNDDSVASLIRHIHMPTFMEENPPTESTSGHT